MLAEINILFSTEHESYQYIIRGDIMYDVFFMVVCFTWAWVLFFIEFFQNKSI